MKNILLLIATAALLLASCKKDDGILPDLTIGKTYHFKDHIFNKGAYQPVNQLLLDSLYIDPISGKPYAKVFAKINWDEFATSTKHGADTIIVSGNLQTLKYLNSKGIFKGYDKPIDWAFPQKDLKN